MRARTEEMKATAQRHQETLHKAEMKYREKMQILEGQRRQSRENLRKSKEAMRQASPTANVSVSPTLSEAETFALADDILKEMRKVNPEWETRRQAAMQVRP